MIKILLTIIFLNFFFYGFSQEKKSINAKYTESKIILDGNLEEEVWKSAPEGKDFFQFFPTDSLPATYQTTIKVLYSETNLYIGFKAYYENSNVVVSSLKRDFGALTNDNVSLLFDTFNDGTTAFFFGVTPLGVRREGLVSEGGSNYNNTWDIKWDAEAKRFEDYYTVEIVIPFSSLKFIEGTTKWGFKPYRWNIQSNEQSTWIQTPQNQLLSSLAHTGELIFEKPLGKSKKIISLIPYTNILADRDYTNKQSFKSGINIGGDAKVNIGDGLNLDLTFNPDFSNVEIDDIFTNLTRFELRIEEKRQFFIDNSDLFESFGNSFNEAKPFFSRRIGLEYNKDGELIQNNIIAGARLSGKLNEDWRVGLFNIQTAKDVINNISSYNNLMGALQRKIGARSNIGIFLTNKQSTNKNDLIDESQKFNRVIGLDYNLASKDNTVTGKFYIHKSFQPGDYKGNLSMQKVLHYNLRKWLFINDLVYVDKDFRADLGFVPRRDILKAGQFAQRIFYPSKGIFNTHKLGFLLMNFWKPSSQYKKIEHFVRISLETELKNSARANLFLYNNYVQLNYPFNPSRKKDATPLPKGSSYSFNSLNFNYQSSNSNLFTYSGFISLGEFYNGTRASIESSLNYRIQPWINMGINLRYDDLNFPKPYSDANLWLISSRLEFTFNRSFFWNNLIQYSNQRENFGINSRLQWRFAPLSDLYLVYNDNYITTDSFLPRFRSINLKLSYWLNL